MDPRKSVSLIAVSVLFASLASAEAGTCKKPQNPSDAINQISRALKDGNRDSLELLIRDYAGSDISELERNLGTDTLNASTETISEAFGDGETREGKSVSFSILEVALEAESDDGTSTCLDALAKIECTLIEGESCFECEVIRIR